SLLPLLASETVLENPPTNPNPQNTCSSLLNTLVKDIDGNEVNLCKYQGKVLLIVNTASKCGFTKQFYDLEKIYEQFKGQGLEILAFPSNDFANQEPANEEQIKNICRVDYKTTFPLFSKTHVKGKNRSQLYENLTSGKGDVQWNFQKYLVNKKGQVVKKFAPWVSPSSQDIVKAINEELKK
ncbi:MAG: glutathione peroxidase, partial [Candidatus Caenarcaniphilales bacterium]|nr:glutathione peroxidase [Candidatus Caenarcaniphilales bacterium]